MLSLFGLVMALGVQDAAAAVPRALARSTPSISGRLTESFSGVRVVKAYGAERREALVFAKGAHRLFRNIARRR